MECDRVNDNERTPQTYTELFKECFPFYLSIGMTYEEFWEGDCTLPIFYRKAYEIKTKSDREVDNFNAWLNGYYMSQAIASCFSKDFKYPEKPIEMSEKEKQQQVTEKTMLDLAEGFRQVVQQRKKYAGGD